MKKLTKFLMLGMLGLFGFSLMGGTVALVNAQSFDLNAGETSGLGVAGAGSDKSNSLIDVVKTFINWVLSLLGLIALVVLLRGGFQMITAAGDDTKYQNGFKILKQAGIGLVFIGLSWFIVSIIFWLVGTTAAGGTTG